MTNPSNHPQLSVDERLQQLEQKIEETQSALRLQADQMDKVLGLLSQMAPAAPPSGPAAKTDGPPIPGQLESFVSRRSMLKKAALATLGAATVLESMPSARASNPIDLVLGATNTGTATTTLTSSAPATSVASAATLAVTNTASTYTGIAVSATSSTGSAVYAASTSGSAIYAYSSGSDGIQTHSDSGSGIYAMTKSTDPSSFAAVATAISGTGLGATGGQYGAYLEGQLAPLYLAGSGNVATPYALAVGHNRGELFVDSSGGLWYCVASGTPGTWNRLAASAPAHSLNAGNFALLAAPTRFIDTRPSSSSYTGTARPAYGGGVTTYIFSGSGALVPYTSTGTTAPVIPLGATGLIGRLTVLNGQNGHTTTSGQLKVSNVNPPGFGSGLIIWGSAPATQILPFVLGLDNSSGTSGKMYFVNTSTSDVVDLIVDVTGYYY